MPITNVQEWLDGHVRTALEARAAEGDHVDYGLALFQDDFEFDPEDEDDHVCCGRMEMGVALHLGVALAGDSVRGVTTATVPLSDLHSHEDIDAWVNEAWDFLVVMRLDVDVDVG